MQKSEESGEVIAVGCLGSLILVPLGIILRGWVLSIIWGWFIVPFDVAPITLPHALGLSLVVGMFAPVRSAKDEGWLELLERACVSVLAPLVTLLCAWIVRFWM